MKDDQSRFRLRYSLVPVERQGSNVEPRRRHLQLIQNELTYNTAFIQEMAPSKPSKGVSLRSNGKWQTRISRNSKVHYVGTYDTEEEARQAYIDASQKKEYQTHALTVNRGMSIGYSNNWPRMFKVASDKAAKKFQASLKYRTDFHPDNADRTLTCRVCKRSKRRFYFFNHKSYASGKFLECKVCNIKNRDERRLNFTRDQFVNHLFKTCQGSAARRRAKGRALDFEITADDIHALIKSQNNKCVYTGRELEWSLKAKNKASLDRIDASKGYTKDNIQLVVWRINEMKSNMEELEFLGFVRDTAKHLLKLSRTCSGGH